MKEPLIIHNFVKTGEGYGLDLRAWLHEELQMLYAGACPDDPCVVNPFTVLRTAITLIQEKNTEQDATLADHTAELADHETRILALE